MLILFTRTWGRPQPDHEAYREGQRLADLVEPLRFDSLWSVEHHFDDDTMAANISLSWPPGPRVFNSAARSWCCRGTTRCASPSQLPYSIFSPAASCRSALDGGGGAAQVEYDGFRVSMDTRRARFTEATEVVIKALMNERSSHTGEFYQIPDMNICPQPGNRHDGPDVWRPSAPSRPRSWPGSVSGCW